MKGGGTIEKPIETAGNRGWIPSDAVGDLLREISEELEDPGTEQEDEGPASEAPPPPVAAPRPRSQPLPPTHRSEHQIPGDIEELLSGPDKEDYHALMRWHSKMLREEGTFIEVDTSIGSVRCPLAHFQEDHGLLQMFLTKKQQVFVPKEGAQLELTVHHRGEVRRYGVMCVLPPIPIPGIGVDLMVFTVESGPVEKNARLEVGAPSSVSGKPSTGTSNGEAVAHGEEASPPPAVKAKDFDVPRDEKGR